MKLMAATPFYPQGGEQTKVALEQVGEDYRVRFIVKRDGVQHEKACVSDLSLSMAWASFRLHVGRLTGTE